MTVEVKDRMQSDSLFVTNIKNADDIRKFISECYILLGMDVEVADVYEKFLITKKKHYFGISHDENKEPVIKGMEGIKSDRPLWINKIERHFAEDIKYGKDPTVNILREYRAMETGQVQLDDLAIKLVLQKDASDYGKNSLQRVVGNELDAKRGDTIVYYKSDIAGGGTSSPNLISRRKYLEMLKTTVEDSLKFMGYDFGRNILGQLNIHDSK